MPALKSLMTCLMLMVSFGAFADQRDRAEVQTYERPGRPTLRKGVIVLFPFTLLTRNASRYTFYEPANRLKIFNNGDVYYEQVTRFGDVDLTGNLDAEDFLMPIADRKMDNLRVGQTLCLRYRTIYMPAGTSVTIQSFYEKGYVLTKSGDLFHALEGRRFAFHASELGRCR